MTSVSVYYRNVIKDKYVERGSTLQVVCFQFPLFAWALNFLSINSSDPTGVNRESVPAKIEPFCLF